MRRRSLGLYAIIGLLSGGSAAAVQLPPIPYDSAAANRIAAEIRRGDDVRTHDEGERLQFLCQSVAGTDDVALVSNQVISAIASRAASGLMARTALVRFGDRAIAPLIHEISSARRSWAFLIDDLRAVVKAASADGSLTSTSLAGVRAMLAKLLATPGLTARDRAAADLLGREIATASPR